MKPILLSLLLLSCSDKISTYSYQHEVSTGYGGETTQDAEESSGGSSNINVTEQSGGSGGFTSLESSGGSLSPPFIPTCERFTCGSITVEGVSSNIYCLNVENNLSSNGNFNGKGCNITLNGDVFNNFSNGVPGGQLLIWGCDFWFNCY